MPLCEYGCEQEAKHQFGNGKWCCSKTTNSCLGKRKRLSKSQKGKHFRPHDEKTKKKISRSRIGISYGPLSEDHKNKIKDSMIGKNTGPRSEEVRNTISESLIGRTLSEDHKNNIGKSHKGKKYNRRIKVKRIENLEHKLCDYGCKLEAQYEFANGKLCCSEAWQKCIVNRKKNGERSLGRKYIRKNKVKKIENFEGKLCDYGCGLKAEYQLINRKLCCNENYKLCTGIHKKMSKTKKGISNGPCSEETKRKISKAHKGRINGPLSEDHKNKIRNSLRYSIKDWIEKYPLLDKVEELRYHPETGEIQGHCKNSNCKNSKEKGGWYTLLSHQLYNRCQALSRPYAFEENNFYCCDKCKDECVLHNLSHDPFLTPKDLPYTSEEYGTFKQEVLRKDNYICHFCGKQKATIVHHTRPQKLEPFFSLDPDYGISVCEECHYFIHRSKEQGGICSNGELANTICT
jgi:hypothetical protein